ncbi:MAG: CehA/McbA family metallohydrolase domain-containing protein [Planctomycetota bacterium]|jgi:hypothetical protein
MKRILIPWTAAGALVAGFLLPALPTADRAGDNGIGSVSPYLMELHMHGSLSEHEGTMTNHTANGELFGYDGIWWVDHMDRIVRGRFPFTAGFENTLDGRFFAAIGFKNTFTIEEDIPGSLVLGYGNQSPSEGSFHLESGFSAPAGSGWVESRMLLEGFNRGERTSLMSEPRFQVDARDAVVQGEAGFLLRCTLSSEPDGVTKQGIPYVVEYVPSNFTAPPASGPQVLRQALPAVGSGSWTRLLAHPATDAVPLSPLGWDMAQRKFHLVFFARDGGSVDLDLDDLVYDVTGINNLLIYQEQKNMLDANLSSVLFHHVGSEIAGPFDQQVTQYSTRDHLLGLYDGTPPELESFLPGRPLEAGYPETSISWIQGNGGVAVLAHIFGTFDPPSMQGDANAQTLSQRVRSNRAWGADAMEIGYVQRGRLLKDFVRVWDNLSSDRVYITGVGTSDDHWVLPWDLRINRFGSWLRSPDTSAASLLTTIRGGQVFFGDPHVFDPEGDVVFEQVGGAYDMGDVVPTAASTEDLSMTVSGARIGDELVLLHNRMEIARWSFTTTSLSVTRAVAVAPGDWLRLEVRDGNDAAFLYSNPIYYTDLGTSPPPDR